MIADLFCILRVQQRILIYDKARLDVYFTVLHKQRVLPQAKEEVMAIARLSVKSGKLGKAQPHAAYISRQGQYANRLNRGEKLEASDHGNMPDWAAHNPLEFWQAADRFERKNGSTYREHEIALPRELSSEQRLALVNDWVKQEIGDNHAYQFAIHNPSAADGQEQPHVHLMFSERKIDGIERDPDHYFKRYNAKNPERGGAKKTNTGLKHSERKERLLAQRQRWQDLCNQHLEKAGIDQSIDMRSYQNQGKDQQPEPKYLPSEWRKHKNEIVEFRKSQKLQQQTQEAVKQGIKEPGLILFELKQGQREKQQQALEQKIEKGIEQFTEKFEQWERNKAKEDQQKRLDPEHIEKVFNHYWDEEKQQHEEQLTACDKAIKATHAAHSTIFRAKPERPQGLFARFKEKQYQKDLSDWEEQEETANHQRIQAKQDKDDFRRGNNPLWNAEQRFKQDHPDMARERERLEKEERERRMEAIHKEFEQRRVKEQERDGGLEL